MIRHDDTKAVFGSAKAADVRRAKAGAVKTAKLPTSIEELRTFSSAVEQRPLNPRVRGSTPRGSTT